MWCEWPQGCKKDILSVADNISRVHLLFLMVQCSYVDGRVLFDAELILLLNCIQTEFASAENEKKIERVVNIECAKMRRKDAKQSKKEEKRKKYHVFDTENICRWRNSTYAKTYIGRTSKSYRLWVRMWMNMKIHIAIFIRQRTEKKIEWNPINCILCSFIWNKAKYNW